MLYFIVNNCIPEKTSETSIVQEQSINKIIITFMLQKWLLWPFKNMKSSRNRGNQIGDQEDLNSMCCLAVQKKGLPGTNKDPEVHSCSKVH